uniref:Uncharacterized protein n=1 Tax=viral metagenome TaxID=1070528 RepID=A0A6C0J5H4_9ZZZZ
MTCFGCMYGIWEWICTKFHNNEIPLVSKLKQD